jgi:hypothetical protein
LSAACATASAKRRNSSPLAHEVGLAVHLDQHALPAVRAEGDAITSLGRDATGFLVGLGDALLAQSVGRLIDVALGLHERRLAFQPPSPFSHSPYNPP